MAFFRNILLIIFSLGLGSSLFAAKSSLFAKNETSKIHVDFDEHVKDDLDLSFLSGPPPVIFETSFSIELSPVSKDLITQGFWAQIKKPYLFIYSGTSPPLLS